MSGDHFSCGPGKRERATAKRILDKELNDLGDKKPEGYQDPIARLEEESDALRIQMKEFEETLQKSRTSAGAWRERWVEAEDARIEAQELLREILRWVDMEKNRLLRVRIVDHLGNFPPERRRGNDNDKCHGQ